MQKDLPVLYKVYLLRCNDGSLYAGQTSCLYKRFREHIQKEKGAKYTRRGVKDIVYISFHQSRSEALKEELRLKHLSKKEKEDLAAIKGFNC